MRRRPLNHGIRNRRYESGPYYRDRNVMLDQREKHPGVRNPQMTRRQRLGIGNNSHTHTPKIRGGAGRNYGGRISHRPNGRRGCCGG